MSDVCSSDLLCGPKHYACVTISPAKVVQRCAGAGIWGILVRFNDLMQTVLAAEGRSGLGAVTLWRQCVDLLAQNDRHDRPIMSDAERAALLERLSGLLPKLSETQRIATVVELGGR